MDKVHPAKFAEIRWADVSFLSLCVGGKTQFKGLYKSQDKESKPGFFIGPMLKALDGFEEKGQLATVIYPVNIPDADGEWAGPEVVEGMAHGAMRKGLEIDIHHDFEPVGSDRAFLSESWILKGQDPRFDGIEGPNGPINSTDLVSSWVGIVQIDDPALRKAYREEGWTGTSIGGGPYYIKPGSAPPSLGKALSMDEVRTSFSSSLRSVLRPKKGLFDPESLRNLSLNVTIPRSGERDFDGNLMRPQVSLRISADLQQ